MILILRVSDFVGGKSMASVNFEASPKKNEYTVGEKVTFTIRLSGSGGWKFLYKVGYVLDEESPDNSAIVVKSETVTQNESGDIIKTVEIIVPNSEGHKINFIAIGVAVDIDDTPTIKGWGTLQSCTYANGVIKIPNTAPTISGNDSDLGDKYEPFNTSIVVSDAQDSGNLQLTIKLDNVQVTTYPVAQNSANNYSIPLAKFNSLTLGAHTLQIIVSDSEGLTATRTYTFTKIVPPNVAPTISGFDENLGQQYKSFTQNFSVNDANPNDIITAIIKVDNEQINSFIAQRNINYVVDLAGIFRGLALGQHIITITASDNNGASTTRTYTFEKINSPYSSIDFIKTVTTRKLVSEITYICEEFINAQVGIDTVYILASNNPFDDEPIWEEVAAAPYEFKNKISVKYGVGIRVIIERNSNESATVLATNSDEIITTNRNEALAVE
ncbi:hypothetical protein CNEO3_640034 [Clostridium neonatale]|nr:hypothetical protein CNEO3_640034 [Clostridium neonatale]